MSWAEWWWRIALTARIAAREHRAANPWRVSITATWPRALLQCLFFTMLGRVLGGDAGQQFAFAGSVAIIIVLFTFGDVADVPMRDRWAATFYRLRLGRLPVPLVYVVRALPGMADAVLVVVLSIVVVGVLTGQLSFVPVLLAHLPFYVLMVLTSAAAGLAAASIGLFGRPGSDVIVANIAMYLIIAGTNALIPRGQVPLLDTVGTVLPMTHALQALRASVDGQPWHGPLVLELAVGAGWALVAVSVYTIAVRRLRRTDHDKVS